MEIIGHGMIARSLEPYRHELPGVVIFASGVANSRTDDPQAYERELSLLYASLRSCQQHKKRLVYFSSAGAIYGETDVLRHETLPTFPTSTYGRHKLLCETVIMNAGIHYLIMRLANLVGRTQNRTQLIPALIEQMKEGHVKLFSGATRDLLDVEDFASILVHLLKVHPVNDLLVVASGQTMPVLSIAEELQQLLGTSAVFDIRQGGDIQHFNIEKLKSLLPEYTCFTSDYPRRLLAKYEFQA